jgi:site-specific DNA-methyltransferase (adenine-specific)
LDPFSGTFTTSYVCEQLGRQSIGIEICPDYYHIGLRRVFGINDYEGVSIRREPKIYEESNEVVAADLFGGVLV